MTPVHKRIDALLVEEATGLMTDAERLELETLLADHPEVDRYGFERAAAAVFLAVGAARPEKMPPSLGSKLFVAAERVLAPRD